MDGPPIEIRRVAAGFVVARLGELAGVYRNCFTVPPWSEDERRVTEFVDRLAADLAVTTVFVAVDGGEVAGFVVVRPTVLPLPVSRAYPRTAQALGDRVPELLAGGTEVDELAVRPSSRGRGLGRRLLDAATTGGSIRSWLVTGVDAAPTREFYFRVGWQEVARSTTGHNDVVVLLGPRHPAVRQRVAGPSDGEAAEQSDARRPAR